MNAFLSTFIPIAGTAFVALVIFLIVMRKKLRAMREKEGSVYKRLFEKK